MLENSVNWEDFLYPYKQAVDELTLKFETIRDQKLKTGQYSEIEEVHGRVKKVSSILEKLDKNDYNIEDIEIDKESIDDVILKLYEDYEL